MFTKSKMKVYVLSKSTYFIGKKEKKEWSWTQVLNVKLFIDFILKICFALRP